MKRVELLKSLDIGTSIKKLREKKGLSQEQLAKDICDRTNITKLENGHTKIPSLSFILLLCERLDITIEEFLNFAMANSYSLNRKLILDLLMNNNMCDLEKYLNDIDDSCLSKNSLLYYKYLLGKVYISRCENDKWKSLLLEIISQTHENYIKILSYHELIKNHFISANEEIYSYDNLNKIINKNSPLEYIYFIDDLFKVNMNSGNYTYCKYLIELEIRFINSHECYRYLPIYYKNKIELYKDDINSVKDIKNKLLALEGNNRLSWYLVYIYLSLTFKIVLI